MLKLKLLVMFLEDYQHHVSQVQLTWPKLDLTHLQLLLYHMQLRSHLEKFSHLKKDIHSGKNLNLKISPPSYGLADGTFLRNICKQDFILVQTKKE